MEQHIHKRSDQPSAIPVLPAADPSSGSVAKHPGGRGKGTSDRDGFRIRVRTLKLFGEGLSTKEVGARLGINHKTAEYHRGRVMYMMGLQPFDVPRLVAMGALINALDRLYKDICGDEEAVARAAVAGVFNPAVFALPFLRIPPQLDKRVGRSGPYPDYATQRMTHVQKAVASFLLSNNGPLRTGPEGRKG